MVGLLALIVAALFTGAAFYVNFAEQPARMALPPAAAVAQWQPSYRRGYIMQASLAVAGFVLGIAAGWTSGTPGFYLGGLLMVANWPWTYLAMLPLNNRMMAFRGTEPETTIRASLARWNRLHAVRTALGASAVGTFLVSVLV